MIINKKFLLLPLKLIFNRRYLRSWIITSMIALAALLAGLAVPYVVKLTVDEGISKKNLTLFLLLCLSAAGVIFSKYILDTIVGLRRQAMTSKIRFDLNRHIFRKMHAMPLSWFSHKAAGQAIYAIDGDSATLIGIAGTITGGFFIDVLKVIITLVIILSFDLRIGLSIILFSPLIGFVGIRRFKKLREIYLDVVGNAENTLNYLEESFWRSYLIKVFNAVGQAVRRYTRLLINDTRLTIKRERQEALTALIPSMLPLIVTGVVYILSGYLAIQGKLSLGALAAIGGYIYQFISASSELLNQWQNLQPGLIAAERLSPLLRQNKDNASILEKNIAIVKGAIKIHQLYFSYDNGPVVLHGLDLDIPAADYTVITGPSGCGKTTLLNLMMRLYPAQKGEIYIDGRNINSLPLSFLGKEIVLCPQEPLLWNASIVENITYPNMHLSWDHIKKAAQLSGADEFIVDMEKGYDTIIGENACRISQGQKQRISLARALVKQPKILLLDEAFSGLPEAEEAKIIERIRSQFAKMTIVAATHRLASLKDRPNVIKIDKGE